MAVAHTLLVVIYHLLRARRPYADLGAAYFDRLDAVRLARHQVRRLEQLGDTVTLTPADVAGGTLAPAPAQAPEPLIASAQSVLYFPRNLFSKELRHQIERAIAETEAIEHQRHCCCSHADLLPVARFLVVQPIGDPDLATDLGDDAQMVKMLDDIACPHAAAGSFRPIIHPAVQPLFSSWCSPYQESRRRVNSKCEMRARTFCEYVSVTRRVRLTRVSATHVRYSR